MKFFGNFWELNRFLKEGLDFKIQDRSLFVTKNDSGV